MAETVMFLISNSSIIRYYNWGHCHEILKVMTANFDQLMKYLISTNIVDYKGEKLNLVIFLTNFVYLYLFPYVFQIAISFHSNYFFSFMLNKVNDDFFCTYL